MSDPLGRNITMCQSMAPDSFPCHCWETHLLTEAAIRELMSRTNEEKS